MNETTIGELTALIAVIGTVAAAYGKALGSTQMALVEWVVAATEVDSRWRGLLNLAIGLILALGLSGLAVWIIGDVRFFAIGVLAGLISSVEAARSHDNQRQSQMS
jgi:hypothetical protein